MNAREMTDKMQDWQQRAAEKARTWGTTTDTYVRENTWTSLAIAAAVGCILGYILASRGD